MEPIKHHTLKSITSKASTQQWHQKQQEKRLENRHLSPHRSPPRNQPRNPPPSRPPSPQPKAKPSPPLRRKRQTNDFSTRLTPTFPPCISFLFFVDFVHSREEGTEKRSQQSHLTNPSTTKHAMHVNHRCRPQISPRDASTACATTSSLANAKMQSARSGTRRLSAEAAAVERVPPRKLLQRSKAAGERQDGVRWMCRRKRCWFSLTGEGVCFVPTATGVQKT